MKTITITAFKRPDYLATMLADLGKNDCSDFHIFGQVDPGDRKCFELIEGFEGAASVNVVWNPERLGVCQNPRTALTRAFDAGSTVNIYLEEDIEVAPDVTAIANWYKDIADAKSQLCLILHHHKAGGDPTIFRWVSDMQPLGWIATAAQWETHFKPNWPEHNDGWAHPLHRYQEKSGCGVLQPDASRSKHIGIEGGQFYRHHLYRQNYENTVTYRGPTPPAYCVEPTDG